ncbi:MAG: phage portal protein [Prevotella sp.]|nr:phage portal protein [Prevotella sp.]
MNSINEIFALPTWEERITLIKNSRRTPMPDVKRLMEAWYTDKHRVFDKKFRKNMKTLVKEEYYDTKGVLHPAEFEDEEVARIGLPIEQDIVNIHVAFTVGNEPQLKADTEEKKELDLLKVVRKTGADNKLKFQNKREMRAWLAETEVCEYWYRHDASGFWRKVRKKVASLVGITVQPKYKMRMQIWSPFRGDKLYPIFSDNGRDYLGIGREYEYKLANHSTMHCFMLVTEEEVYMIQRGESGSWVNAEGYPFKHGFPKNPTIYQDRREELCHNITGARESLETLTSDWSDAIKMNFFPKLILEGDLANGGAENIGKSHLLKITGGGKAYYLDWHQTSDMVKSQCDNLLVRCYSLTNTPLISFDQLKGTGQFPSGTAFDFMFMATLFACARHWEDMGEFYQRRYNFLISAIGTLVPSLKDASETLEVEVEQKPYRIEDLSKRIEDAVNGVSGHVMSRKQGVLLVGIADEYQEELDEIEGDMKSGETLQKE